MCLPILNGKGNLTALVPSLTYLNMLASEQISRNVKYLEYIQDAETNGDPEFITSDGDPEINK